MDIKGIDEIPMFSWNTKTKEFYVLGHKFDGINSIEDFINYIHNLDKENKHLKEINSFSKRELYKINKDRLDANLKLVKENKKLKEQLGNSIVEFGYKETKYKSVLDEIREQTKIGITTYQNGGSRTAMFEVFDTIKNEILDKVKE